MPVYFLYAESTNKVKIGFAEKVYKRLKDIQSTCPIPVKCVKVITPEDGKTDRQTEREFHLKFKPYRIGGEWFSLEGELKEYLNGCLDEDIIKRTLLQDGWKTWRGFNRWLIEIHFYCPFNNHGRYLKKYFKTYFNGLEDEANTYLKGRLKHFETLEAKLKFLYAEPDIKIDFTRKRIS